MIHDGGSDLPPSPEKETILPVRTKDEPTESATNEQDGEKLMKRSTVPRRDSGVAILGDDEQDSLRECQQAEIDYSHSFPPRDQLQMAKWTSWWYRQPNWPPGFTRVFVKKRQKIGQLFRKSDKNAELLQIHREWRRAVRVEMLRRELHQEYQKWMKCMWGDGVKFGMDEKILFAWKRRLLRMIHMRNERAIKNLARILIRANSKARKAWTGDRRKALKSTRMRLRKDSMKELKTLARKRELMAFDKMEE